MTPKRNSSWVRRDNVTYVDFYLHRPSVAAAFALSYLLIFLLCMLGNGVVCLTVLRRRSAPTVTNVFILNLAVSDLLVGVFCMPTTLVDNIITGWPFGNVVCKLSGTVQGISVSASVFTLVAIAVDRFRCVVYPFEQKLSVAGSKIIVAVIWALAASISCPSGVTLHAAQEPGVRIVLRQGDDSRPFYWCRENWPSPDMRKVYTTVLFVNIYLAPLILIVVMYARIGLALFRTARPVRASLRGGGTGSGTEKKKRAIAMLLVVALLFIVSWLPLWTLMMLSDYASLTEGQYRVVNIYLYPLAHWLAFFNSSVNPIIYGFFNENFRRGFRAAFKLQLCAVVVAEHQRSFSLRALGNAVGPFQPAVAGGSGSPRKPGCASEGSLEPPKELARDQNLIVEDLQKGS
ncbi:neuropeptide FF receptor 2-like [Syngnathoides biaculeatus]|uniref:neuropeptide FF receptor 2-like n=1 Tax=Syngnathoides biaculeatus TaxID=300417 RepID=UPI002ADE047B|nr:neuropeptide FF receptor 2-like [Syngnathoides biaculeatus]